MLGILINTIAFVLIASMLPGFRMKDAKTCAIAAIVYFLVGTIAAIVAIPFVLVAVAGFLVVLGPFAFLPVMAMMFALNVGVLVITDKFLEDFEMKDMQTAIIASIILTVINMVVQSMLS